MSNTKALLLVLSVSFVISTGSSAPSLADEETKGTYRDIQRNKLLVLLLDGFKWDYLDHIPYGLGGFKEFIQKGVRVEHVNGIYPTVSYPSWTTLSTGLHAESHGILGNYFYNREQNATFDLYAANDQQFWWKAEPIWTTAVKHELRVGTILWSKSDVPFEGILPQKSQGFKTESNWTAIENTLHKSLRYFIEDQMDLVMAYGEHLDNIGHKYGPKSPELKQALIDVGKVLENFFHNLTITGLRDKVNVLIVSDHGMTDGSIASGVRFHELKDYINMSNIEYLMDQGAMVQVYTKPGRVDEVYRGLQAVHNNGISVFERPRIPTNFHFANNDNAPDILLVAEQGNLMVGVPDPKQVPERFVAASVQGVHGFNPHTAHDMRTVFMATGPDFKEGVLEPAIDLVDIYQIYCHLLQIPPRPHNGTWNKVERFFVASSDAANHAGAANTSLSLLVLLLITHFLN